MSKSGEMADTVARLEADLAHARRQIHSWEQLANSAHDVISRIDAEGRITYVSPSVRKVLGYEPNELVGQMAHGFIDPQQQAERRAGFDRGVKEGVAPTVVARARRKDGSYIWMEYRTEVLRDAEGKVTGFQSISQDVTALEQSKLDFETFVRAMPVPALVHSGGTIVLVNATHCTTFGYAEDDVVGRKVIDMIDPVDRAYIDARLKQPSREVAGVPTREHRVLHADGTGVPVEVTVVPVVFRGSSHTLAVFRDLRERKRLEAQLITAERMVSLGRLAAAVGHEINNPLAYVLSSLSLMERELGCGDRSETVTELLANVREGAERIRTVAEDLRMFSRERTETHGPIDIVRLLDRAASMADHEVRHRARLVKDYAALPPIEGNEARLGQVFLNLLVNAAQAIPEGNAAENEVRIEGRVVEDRVAVDVVDTGVGIEPENVQRIFEPFFTTKAADGTGLGLSISNHIVTSLGGSLVLVSSRARETRFRVVLPTAR